MLGKIIDLNSIEAYINLEDGRTVSVCISKLPGHIKIGDSIPINSENERFTEDIFHELPDKNNFF